MPLSYDTFLSGMRSERFQGTRFSNLGPNTCTDNTTPGCTGIRATNAPAGTVGPTVAALGFAPLNCCAVGDTFYSLTLTFPHTAASLSITFSYGGLQGLFDESWGLDKVTVETNAADDDDSDGVPNAADQCPGTPAGLPVNANGCASPVANAGPDQTVPEGTLVTLDGSGSFDPDGGSQPLSFAWVQLSGQVLPLAGADTARPSFTAPPVRDSAHTLVFRVTVSDGALSATDTVSVVVQALPASPLGCEPVRPRPGTLWPPNHQLVPVVLMWTAVETPATVTILGVTQDEPTEGTGDGDTAPDAEGLQGNQVRLRAERAGGGNGRFYHVRFRAERGAESCVGQVQVVVPPNLGRTTRPVDDNPRFESATGAPVPLP